MAKSTTRTMSAQHKAALAEGRSEGRAVKNYLEALQQNRPRRGRRRTPDSIKKRLSAIDAEFGDVSALQQLQLVQERMDLQKELEAMDTKVDLSALESDFVKTASKYAAAQGHLLRGVARARRPGRRAQESGDLEGFVSSATRVTPAHGGEQRLEQHDPVGAAEQGVAGPLRVRHEADDVARLVADAGDVVEAAVGVVDVADDDAILGPEARRASRRRTRSCPRSG